MNQEKIEIVKDQMDKANIGLLGVSELKWTEQQHFKLNEHWIFYSGHKMYKKNGVAFILNNKLSKMVLKYNRDRVISIRL